MHQLHSPLLLSYYALRLILICAVLHPFCVFANAVVAERPFATPTVTLGNGRLVGTATTVPGSTVTVNQYLGVPFAEPPRRFFPPEARGFWGPYLTVTAKSPACIQQFDYPPEDRAFKERIYNYPPPAAGESEDCLYLNVYTPVTGIIDEPKAVLVWFYGGNLKRGSNAIDMYDGTSFAANQDVLVVAANYRTNVFGFPNNPEMNFGERNLGFLDQRLALDWVQANIYLFGGDPNKVTIFGQSAGSASVDILITSMGNKRDLPFRAGIMQSGQASLYTKRESRNYTDWNALAKAVGCGSAANITNCVRGVNASEIKSVLQTQKLRFLPVIDEETVVGDPEKERRTGHIARVPIMLGLNADEGRYFTYNVTDTLGWLMAFAPNIPKSFWEGVIEKYPIPSPGIANSSQQLAHIVTDFAFQCSASAVAKASKTAGFPTWRYYFEAVFPNNQPFPNLGAFHAAEIPIVFGTYNRTDATKGQIDLSKSMQTIWATFAKNPQQGPGWSQSPNVHVFGTESERDIPASGLDEKCELYASLAEADTSEAVDRLMIGRSANLMQQPLYYH